VIRNLEEDTSPYTCPMCQKLIEKYTRNDSRDLSVKENDAHKALFQNEEVKRACEGLMIQDEYFTQLEAFSQPK
jgi:hypothetical protein